MNHELNIAALLEGSRAGFTTRPHRGHNIRDNLQHAKLLGGHLDVSSMSEQDLDDPEVVSWVRSRKNSEWVKSNMSSKWIEKNCSERWKTKYLSK